MHRKRNGKRIELGERDIEIFQLLQRYRYLRSTFIHEFVGGKSHTRFKERLGDLFHEGYLARPPQQWQSINARYSPAIYELDKLAEAALKELGIENDHPSDLVRRGRMGANRQFAHAMMICDTLASIELGVRLAQGIRFVSWREILTRAPERTRHLLNPFAIPVKISYTFPRTERTHRAEFKIVPDGLFGLEYLHGNERTFRFFALEAERMNRVVSSNLRQTSWLKKVLAYREIATQRIFQSHLGIPNLIVLVVTPTVARIATMKKLIMDITNQRGSTMFCFRHIPTIGYNFKTPLPSPDLFTYPWARAGQPNFSIGRQ